ncbi:Os02g0451900, partial [Oryza sativa Japonica Group]
ASHCSHAILPCSPCRCLFPFLPCYGGSWLEPRRAATARPPMPLAGSGELVRRREKELGGTAAAAAESRRGGMS